MGRAVVNEVEYRSVKGRWLGVRVQEMPHEQAQCASSPAPRPGQDLQATQPWWHRGHQLPPFESCAWSTDHRETQTERPKPPRPPTWYTSDAAVQAAPILASVSVQTVLGGNVSGNPPNEKPTQDKAPPPRPPVRAAAKGVATSDVPFKQPPSRMGAPPVFVASADQVFCQKLHRLQ